MAEISIMPFEKIELAARWDAEYYQPQNQSLNAKLISAAPVTISSIADEVTDGIHASPDWVEAGGITYLSAKCVKDNIFDLSSAGLISKEQNKANPRTQARLNDVLITTVGTIGNSAVVTSDLLPANMDRHLGIIRVNENANVDPYYLATFLNCRFGRFQTNREATGNVQLNLFIDKIKKILVPVGKRFNEAGGITRRGYEKMRDVERLYPEAEAELLERMEWEKLIKRQSELFYAEKFASIQEQARYDAEYFQPQYKRLQKHLLKKGAKKILTFCPIPTRGIQPEYAEDGDVLLINSQDLTSQGIDIAAVERTTKEFYALPSSARARINKYDVLVYATGAYIGRTNAYLNDNDAIAGIDIIIIRPDWSTCHPVYLSLFLNSKPGILQSIQAASGSAQRHIYPKDLAKLIVYLPTNKNGSIDLEWQEKLADKVIQASKAKAEARQLLEKAKQLVEDLIVKPEI